MKKEIKEILDKLKDGNWYEELDLTGTMWIELTWEETHLLLDYITNLQEENKEYKRLMTNIDMNSVDYVYNKDTKLYTFDRKNWYKINKKLDERFNYKQRIDKAIEYIENLPVMFYPDDFYEDNHKEIEWDRNNLLDILKGSDE